MPRIRAESIAEHKEITRRHILAAARGNFLDYGYADTALADIALDAGVGRTTLYEYFDDKEAILVELVNAELPALLDSVLAAIPAGLTARQLLGELVIRHLEFIADESNLGTLLMRESNRLSAAAQRDIRKAHRVLEHAIVEAYATGADAGEFRSNIDPVVAGDLINAVTMHAARNLLRSSDPKGEVHATADTILDFIFNGLSVD
jgi:AcrR family transcriptional regulator